MSGHSVSIAFQTDKPITAYGPLAASVEQYGFDGVTVYNDLLFQPAWLPLFEIARHHRFPGIAPLQHPRATVQHKRCTLRIRFPRMAIVTVLHQYRADLVFKKFNARLW